MRRIPLLGLALALGVTACQEQTMAPAVAPDAPASVALQASMATADGLQRPDVEIQLPGQLQVGDLGWLDHFTRRAIDPTDYVCSGTTALFDWYSADVNEFIAEDLSTFILLYVVHWADYIPTYEALYLYEGGEPQEFGYDGRFTNAMNRVDQFARNFWDIETDQIKLLALKGSMLMDVERTANAYQQLTFLPPYFGLSEEDALLVANEIRDAIIASDYLDNGHHSLFSFNAFAIRFSSGLGKIVMGDGILEGYDDLGFGDVAPQAIYAHEFAHHIQFQNGYFSDPFPSAAEATRYTELMADAMSAYFMTHKRGQAMNRHRVAEFLEAFYQIGDCSFASSGHHGTPNQRMRAAQFGFDIADQARVQGHILTSHQFYQLFVAAYPDIIAPDA